MIDLIQSACRFLLRSRKSNQTRRRRLVSHRIGSHESLEPRLLLTAQIDFNFTVISSDLSSDPGQRFFGSPNPSDSPFTILRYGFGEVTSLTGFNDLDQLGTITFSFGSDNTNAPIEALSLTEFNGGSVQPVQNATQVYTEGIGDDATLTVFEDGQAVATGKVTKVSLETTPAQIVTSPESQPSQFEITAAVGNDTTVFDEIMLATDGTGIIDFSLSAFNLTGPWAGIGDAEIFTSTGQSIGLMTTVQPDDHGDDIGTATPWDRLAPIDGAQQTSDDVDVFAVQLQQDTQYTFDIVDNDQIPEDFTWAMITDANDDTVAEGDPVPGSQTVSVSVTPKTSGTYYIYAFPGQQRGSYQISQRSEVDVSIDDHGDAFNEQTDMFDASDATPWDRQSPIAGNIGCPQEADAFSVELNAGTEYVFRTNAGTLYDTILDLIDATTGEIIDSNDDAPEASDFEYYSELTFVPETTGTYLLVVTGYGVDGGEFEEAFRVGSYTLEMTSETVLPPAVPVINEITSPLPNGLPTISWNSVARADEYHLYISPWDAPASPVVNMAVNDTSYTLSNELDNGIWSVWVRARTNQGGNSAWSRVQNFRVATAPSLTPDSFNLETDTPTLTWTAVGGAQSYNLYISNITTGAAGVVNMSGINSNTYTAGSSLAFGSHRVWVQAVDGDGRLSGWSEPVVFWEGVDPISGVGVSVDYTPTFSWQPIPGASTYRIYVRHPGLVEPIDMSGLNTNSYTPIDDLTDGTATWWVQASGPGGTTRWGDAQVLNIGGGPVLSAASPTIVSWDAVDGAARYEIFVSQVSSPARYNRLNLSNVTTTTYDLAGLERSRTYRVWVRAIRDDGTFGDWSNSVDMLWSIGDLT